MSVPLETLLRVLRRYPSGVTTRALADELGMTHNNLSSRLSKCWLYGGPIDRDVIKEKDRRYMIWRAK